MTEHKQIWNWMEFRDHIAKRPEINDKYPISLVCKAVAARNEPFVWDAYTAYLNYCALQTTAFKSTGSLKIPLAAAVHYGCGLLGRWNTLLLENSQQEYFRYGKDGWNSLTEVSRKRFLSFYRSELPTRSHLASNPFLNRPFLVMLGLSDDRDGLCDTGACFEKMVPLEAKALLLPNDGKQKNRKAQQKNRKAQFLFIDYRVCKRLHKWLTTSDDVDDFLDGLEPKIESLWLLAGDKCQLKEFIAARITADEPSVNCAKKKAKIKLAQMSNEKKTPLLGNDQWTNLICCINKAAPNIIPKVGKKEAQLSRIATRAAALRTFMVANYFALHLGIFSDGAKSEESKGKYGELASCGAILSCIAPLYTRPSSNGESIGFEYCDFANYIAGYAVKSGNGGEQALKSVLKKLAEQVDTLQSVVACFARIEQLALAHRHTPVSLLTENIIRECCVIDDEVLHHVNKWRYWFEENLSHVLPSNRSKAGKGSKFVADLLDNDKMVGASRKVTDILDRMCRLVGNRHTCKDNSRTETDFRCVFLYSEPGCGKENIAKIVHLLGLPILAKRPFVNTIAWTRNRAQDLFELTNDSPEKWQKWLNSWGDLEKTEESII
ncbi:MAG: hypothetical protein KJ831_12745, partial [Candidatus Eisenbacteria bacterium]|nr:hypothetical protein [Candidatus Eisenbacteria bacterium]